MLASTVAVLYNNDAHGDDCYVLRPLGGSAYLDAVMDGVTGRRGRDASQTVADALTAAALASPDDVVGVLQAVNQTLYRHGGGHWWLTTVAVALFLADTMFVVSAGDSPVWLIRPDSDHALRRHVRGGGKVGSAGLLGAGPALGALYRAEVTVQPGDRLVLATDGVASNVPSRELVDIVRYAATPEAAVERLRAILAARPAVSRVPAPPGRRQGDDWTAILRFFSPATGQAPSVSQTPGALPEHSPGMGGLREQHGVPQDRPPGEKGGA